MHPEQAKQSANRAVTNRVGAAVGSVASSFGVVVVVVSVVVVTVSVSSSLEDLGGRRRRRLCGITTTAAAGAMALVLSFTATADSVLITVVLLLSPPPPPNNGFTQAADGDTKSSTKFNTMALPNSPTTAPTAALRLLEWLLLLILIL